MHYYAPQVSLPLEHARCGGPDDTVVLRRGDITAKFFINLQGVWDFLQNSPEKAIKLNINFHMPAGTSLRFGSDMAQVFVDDSAEPLDARLTADSWCNKAGCGAPMDIEIAGYTRPVKGYDGVTRSGDLWLTPELTVTGLKAIPDKIKFVIPPMSFNGGPQETITLPFKLSSGVYAVALNGC